MSVPQKEFQFPLRLVFSHWIFNGKEKLFSPFLMTRSSERYCEKLEKAFVLSKCPVPDKIPKWVLIQGQKWILDTLMLVLWEWESTHLQPGILLGAAEKTLGHSVSLPCLTEGPSLERSFNLLCNFRCLIWNELSHSKHKWNWLRSFVS